MRRSKRGMTPRATRTRSGPAPSRRPTWCARASRAGSVARRPRWRSAPTRTSWWCASSRRCRSPNGPRLVTTDGEFHTLRRQLDRLREARMCEVVKLAAEPVETLAERLASQVDNSDGRGAGVVGAVRQRPYRPWALPGRQSLRARRRGVVGGCVPPPERGSVRPRRTGARGRVRHRRRLQVLPAGRGQLLPARAVRLRPAARHHRLVQRVREALGPSGGLGAVRGGCCPLGGVPRTIP